jgi:hypothetical protein
MKKLVAILMLASTLATSTVYANPSAGRVRPIPRHTNYVIVHDHNHTDEVVAGVMIGLGVALVIYAFTSEYRDPTRLTYRF